MGEPPICTREELGRVRSEEVRCAGSALGAASVEFLGYIDPVCVVDGEVFAFEADFDVLVRQIRDLISVTGAEVVISHGTDGEYGHPAHKLLNKAVTEAISGMRQARPIFYTWAASVPGIEDRVQNQNDPAHFALDVSPWLDRKAAALDCHRTQHYLFLRRRENATGMIDVARKTEAFRRQIPPAEDGAPDDAFADLLRAVGAWSPDWTR
jgi:N-acetylglucosamine malate deacetylase 2